MNGPSQEATTLRGILSRPDIYTGTIQVRSEAKWFTKIGIYLCALRLIDVVSWMESVMPQDVVPRYSDKKDIKNLRLTLNVRSSVLNDYISHHAFFRFTSISKIGLC